MRMVRRSRLAPLRRAGVLPRPGITADRRVQIDLGLRWRHRTLIPQSTPRLPPQGPGCCPELSNTALREDRAFPALSDKWCQLPRTKPGGRIALRTEQIGMRRGRCDMEQVTGGEARL
ncbi:hypothetical protein GCM10010094_89690 [Streptomyces flaveus]|uniref:Uncharacterized protein n=1 Tax=Streptomyces flaveus TaxID=66370 RepID=A0A917RN61_9ACTN|nr:hypothetical protein GCM10010094_89690 [Streptomyces flaveus]